MIKYCCDICRREIRSNEHYNRYKVKKLKYILFDSMWEDLIVHDECWKSMGKYISERRSGDGKTR